MKKNYKDKLIQAAFDQTVSDLPPKAVLTQAKETAYANKPRRANWMRAVEAAAACVLILVVALWAGNAFTPQQPDLYKIFSTLSYESAETFIEDKGVLFLDQSCVTGVDMVAYDDTSNIFTYALKNGADSIVVSVKPKQDFAAVSSGTFGVWTNILFVGNVRVVYRQSKNSGQSLYTAGFTYTQHAYTVTVVTQSYENFVFYLENLLRE